MSYSVKCLLCEGAPVVGTITEGQRMADALAPHFTGVHDYSRAGVEDLDYSHSIDGCTWYHTGEPVAEMKYPIKSYIIGVDLALGDDYTVVTYRTAK
jgi:hypothetical protein